SAVGRWAPTPEPLVPPAGERRRRRRTERRFAVRDPPPTPHRGANTGQQPRRPPRRIGIALPARSRLGGPRGPVAGVGHGLCIPQPSERRVGLLVERALGARPA